MNEKELASALKSAKGAYYYELLGQFLHINGIAMCEDFDDLKDEHGKFTPIEVAYIALKYDLNMKATWEYLHEQGHMRLGWDDMHRKFTVAEAYEAARQKYSELAVQA